MLRAMLRFWVGWLAIGLLGLSGCSKDLRVSASPFQGPAIGVDSTGEWHEIVAVLPTPGWELSLDSRRDVMDAERVFITLRRPNPVAVYPQTPVTQRLLTSVRTEKAIEVYARVMAFGDRENRAYGSVTNP